MNTSKYGNESISKRQNKLTKQYWQIIITTLGPCYWEKKTWKEMQ